jgi:BirA family biotin operon repressor/biotin-[acetyl-CoA-carboxylase] ligase
MDSMAENGPHKKMGVSFFQFERAFMRHTNLNGLSLVVGMAIIKSIEDECQSYWS